MQNLVPPDNMFLLRFEEGAAIRIQSLMPRSNAMHLFRPTDSFPSGATHTTLASASASALLLVAPIVRAGAISMEEAYAPLAERLRSWEASHRIHTGRMRKSTRAAVNCGGQGTQYARMVPYGASTRVLRRGKPPCAQPPCTPTHSTYGTAVALYGIGGTCQRRRCDEVDLREGSPHEHAHDGKDEADHGNARAEDAEVAPPIRVRLRVRFRLRWPHLLGRDLGLG